MSCTQYRVETSGWVGGEDEPLFEESSAEKFGLSANFAPGACFFVFVYCIDFNWLEGLRILKQFCAVNLVRLDRIEPIREDTMVAP